jgi:hypothetical protein
LEWKSLTKVQASSADADKDEVRFTGLVNGTEETGFVLSGTEALNLGQGLTGFAEEVKAQRDKSARDTIERVEGSR